MDFMQNKVNLFDKAILVLALLWLGYGVVQEAIWLKGMVLEQINKRGLWGAIMGKND